MKNADGEESTDIVEMDAMDVVEWEREQHTPLATEPKLAALVKQSAETDDGAKRPPATPRPTRTGMPVPLGASPAGELPRATAPAKLLADAAAQTDGPSSRVPNATIPTPQPLMQQLLKSPTKHTTQRTPRLAAQTVPTPPAVQQTLVTTSEKAPVAAPAPVEAPPPGGYEELDDSWDEAPKSSTKSDAQAYSAPTTPRVTTSNTVRRGSSTSQSVVRKTGAMPAAQPPATPRAQPKPGTVTEPLPTVAKPNGANGAITAQQAPLAKPAANDQAKPAATPAATAQTTTAKTRTTQQAPQVKPATAQAKPTDAASATHAAPQQAPTEKPTTAAKPTDAAKPAASPTVAASTKPAADASSAQQQAKPTDAASAKPTTAAKPTDAASATAQQAAKPTDAASAKPTTAATDAASARPNAQQAAKPTDAASTKPAAAASAKPATAQQAAKPADATSAKPATAQQAKPAAAQQAAKPTDATSATPATAQQAPQAKPATAQQAPQAKPATAQAKPARLATEDKPTLVVEPMAAIAPVNAEPPQRQSEPALLPPPPTASAQRVLPLAPARDDDWDGLAPSKPSKPNPKPISQPDADDFAEDREPSVIIDLNAKPVAPQDLDWGLANAALAADALGSGGTGAPMPIQTSELNTTASGIFVMPTAASPMGRSIGAKSSPAIKLPLEDAETAARSTVSPDDDLEVPAWTPPKSPKTVTGAAAYAPKVSPAAAYAPKPTLADWSSDPAGDAPTGNNWSASPSDAGAPAVTSAKANDWSVSPGTASDAQAFPVGDASAKTSAPAVINPSASAKTSVINPSASGKASAAKTSAPPASDWSASPSTASDAQAFPMNAAPTAFPAPQNPAYPSAQAASAAWPSSAATPPAKPPGVAFAFAPATQQSVQAPRGPSVAELGWEHDPAIPQPLAHTEQTERRFVPRTLLGSVLPTPKAKRLALVIGGGAAGIVLLLVIVMSTGGKSTTAPEKPAIVVETPAPAPPKVEPPKVEPPKPVEVAATDPTPAPVVDEPPKVEPAKPVVRRPARPAKPLVLDYEPKPDAAPAGPTPDQALARARAAYATGNQHLFAGEADAAVEAYKQALAVYPGYVAGYRGLGLAYAQSGDRAAALKAFQKYVALVPNAKDVALIQKRIARLSGQ